MLLGRGVCRYLKSDRKKVMQTVGFIHDHIQNVKLLSYKPKHPLAYKQGRLLLYRHRMNRLGYLIKDYWLYMGMAAILMYCLYIRYNYDSYPIIKHMYVGGLFMVGVLVARRFMRNGNVVGEIYLMEGGKATQIVYRNQLKRKLFGQPASQLYYNSIFAPPPLDPQALHNNNSNGLPDRLVEMSREEMAGSYWVKKYSNESNSLLIPKKYEVMEGEILQEVMQGKVIIG